MRPPHAQQKQKTPKYGDAFALRLLGQRMVFVFDPDAISAFFKSPEADVSFKCGALEAFWLRVRARCCCCCPSQFTRTRLLRRR